MKKGGIGHPCLACIFEVFLHGSPFVPSQKAVETNENESEYNKKDNTDLGSFDQITADIIDDGGVKTVAEFQPVLSRDRQAFGSERNCSEGVVDVFLQ